MPESITVAILAEEMKRQGNTLAALAKTTKEHVDKCGVLNETNARAMTAMATSLTAIERRFVVFDTIVTVVSTHGKKVLVTVGGIIFTAWVSVLVQNVMLHQDTVSAARQASNAANSAASGQMIVLRKLNELQETPGP